MKIVWYILALMVLGISSRIDGSNPPIPNENLTVSSKRDTLKALGILVENNKVSNNPMSVKYALQALNIAKNSHDPADLVDAYKWVGKAYLVNQKDSSYFYYTKALHIADSANLTSQKVHIFYNLASLYSAASNYRDAMALLDSSIRLAERVGENEGIANAYIELGNINYKIHDYEKSRSMYEEAFQIAGNDSMYKQLGVALGNLARRPFVTDTAESREMQRKALFYLGKLNGVEEEMAYIYSNIGTQNVNPDSALRYYNKALNLAMIANQPKIVYATYNNMAYSYLDKKEIAKAESCLRDNAIPLALEKNDNDWLSSLYDTYADVCIEKGDYKTAHEMQRKAMKARDADYRQKALDQVRLLAALLDLKNKEIIIQNEEKELLRSRNRLQKFELGFAIALLLVVGSVFTTLVLQQRSRARLQKQQIGSARRIIEMEETEKGRTARELHDLTGQLVLGISGTIENIDFPDPAIKEQIKDRIKELGASIRKISHKMNRAMIEHFTFSEMITGLCEDVQKLSRMQIDLEIAEDFPDLSNDLVLHFYRISQELLTNAGKYARESRVKMKVFLENDKLVLSYSDNGPGFTAGEKGKQSMGVSNIFERAKLIGGHAKLDTKPGQGTRWEIVFPIAQQAKL